MQPNETAKKNNYLKAVGEGAENDAGTSRATNGYFAGSRLMAGQQR
jgi:hypothetical protein